MIPPPTREFEILEYIDRGSWTVVYKARKRTDSSIWALKFLDLDAVAHAQCEHRDLTDDELWEKEGLGGHNQGHTNLATNFVAEADDGTRFLAEEFIPEFLPSWIEQNPHPSLEQIAQIGTGVLAGLAVLHKDVRRPHADLKPENIGMTNGTVKISDFGATTRLDRVSRAPRDNIGDICARAYECFEQGSKPSARSDVWAAGALVYRLFTGEGLFEPELVNAKDPGEYMRNLAPKAADATVAAKLRRAGMPRSIRRFVQAATRHDSAQRPYDAGEALVSWKAAVDWLDASKRYRTILVRGVPWVASATLLGLLSYVASTHEPIELTMPDASYGVPGHVEKLADRLDIDFEDCEETPKVYAFTNDRRDGEFKFMTHNRYVAFLHKAYDQAIHDVYGDDSWKMYEMEEQHNMRFALESARGETGRGGAGHYFARAVRASIETALFLSQDPGKPGLSISGNDAIAIARLGPERVMGLQRASGSLDFCTYLDATGPDGGRLVPERERDFLLRWQAYANLRSPVEQFR